MKSKNNSRLIRDASRYLAGGVDSPVRSFRYVGRDPIVIRKGKGAHIYDYDGNKYIDYVISWGAAILGHAHPAVVKSIRAAIRQGAHFGATTVPEIELGRRIHKAIPLIEKIRFVNSGTEAVMGAVRLARGFTGRDLIVKFNNSYHGHADYLLAKAGSGLVTLGIPASLGVPRDYAKTVLIAPWGNENALERIFRKYGRQIAAVLVEPVGGNYGVTPPDYAFLSRARAVTKKYGSQLIFDEVITGFRFHYGAIAQTAGIVPDLICLGKIIGGGLPIGAYGGNNEIMGYLAPLGKVYQASTFAGNPIVMRAGLSTLEILESSAKEYSRIKDLTEYLMLNLDTQGRKNNVDVRTSFWGSMFSMKFGSKTLFRKFYNILIDNGVYFAPSEFEADFISFAHTRQDVDKTLRTAYKALKKL